MAFRYNGQPLPSWVKVNKVEASLLPTLSQRAVKVQGRAGSYDFGNEIGERKFKIDITIVADSVADLPAKKRALVDFLYYDDAKPLVFDDEPDKTYYAKITGDTNIEEILKLGQGSLTFVCNDPFAYGTQRTVPISGGSVTVTNNGQVETYPAFHFEFTQPTTEFAIIKDDKYMYFGAPAEVDKKTSTSKRTLILSDNCSSVAGYTAGVGVDGGTIAGSLASDGTNIRQANNDYGSGSTWHGAAGVKTLGQQIQDFTVEVTLGFKAGYDYQIGRIEIYLLDVNNSVIGKFAIRDTTKIDSPWLEARVGNSSTGYYFVSYEGGRGKWKQFDGILRMQRIGQQWRFWAYRKDANGKLYNAFTYGYFDKNNSYQQKLAGFQIHFGAYGSNPAYSTAYIDNINVWKENTIDTNTQVEYVFEAGDKLDIDCASGSILKNGEPFFYALDPTSTFLKLDKGTNTIQISPQNFTNSTITFTERWR